MVMPPNRAVFQVPRDATAATTITPSSATNLVSGSAFTPTAGRLLVVIMEGAVTSTGTVGGTGSTAPSGWSGGAAGTGTSAVNNTGLYVFYKTAAGSDTLTAYHNGSNYPIFAEIFEFPSGSTWVGSVAGTGLSGSASNPTLSGLTGTKYVVAAKARLVATAITTPNVVWSTPTISDGAWTTSFSVTDGYSMAVGYIENYASATWTPTGNDTAGSGGTWEALTFAVNAVSGGTSGSATAVVATVTSLAPIPTVTGASNVSGGGVATATMQAIAPVVTGVAAGSVTAVRATVTALAPVPVVTGLMAATVADTVAIVSTLAPPPVVAGSVSASVSAVVATASALALPPIVSAGGVANVSAVTATVSTLAPTPAVTGLRVASVVAVRGIVTALASPPTVSASSSANVTAVPAVATIQAIAPTVSASSGSLVLAVVALATMRAYAPSVSPSPSIAFEFDYRTSSWVGDAGTNQTWKPLEGPDAWV